ncbi:MAG: hypothetical protein Q4C60_10485 [Eubacteriales bacterium]|nr:hypothetical protein [Eubacteriales bacterium]
MKKHTFLALLAALTLTIGSILPVSASPAATEATSASSTAAAVTVTAAAAAVTEETVDSQTTEDDNALAGARALYQAAVRDSVFADEDKILPLVSLTPDDPMTTWSDDGRVLLMTWHNYPDSYPEGETVSLSWGNVWTFTDKELALRYALDIADAEDQELRMKQLIGFSPDSTHSVLTGFWVSTEDVVRPAYQTDPTIGSMTTSFADGVDASFQEWFDGNILSSYFYGEYPWTRLGYTYDWADNGSRYGLTEFLVKQDAEVEVAFTETTGEFLDRMERGLAGELQ